MGCQICQKLPEKNYSTPSDVTPHVANIIGINFWAKMRNSLPISNLFEPQLSSKLCEPFRHIDVFVPYTGKFWFQIKIATSNVL